MRKREFVIFGVGEFGTNVAKTLANSGATVMVVDKDEKQLEKIANSVTHSICADATDPEAMKQAGIAYATEQIIDLIANGVNHIHIYTMNKPEVAATIMNNLSSIYIPE